MDGASPRGSFDIVRGAWMTFREGNVRFAGQFGIGAQAFSEPVITVELGPDAAKRRGNTAAFLLAVNLLCRTFDNVHAVFPNGVATDWHPWRLNAIDAVIEELSRTVDKELRCEPPRRSDVVLSIGQDPSVPADRQIVVHGSHGVLPWTATFPGRVRELSGLCIRPVWGPRKSCSMRSTPWVPATGQCVPLSFLS